MSDSIRAQLLDDPKCNIVVKQIHEECAHSRACRECRCKRQTAPHGCMIHAAGQRIYRRAEQNWNIQLQHDRCSREQQSQQQGEASACEVGHELLYRSCAADLFTGLLCRNAGGLFILPHALRTSFSSGVSFVFFSLSDNGLRAAAVFSFLPIPRCAVLSFSSGNCER